jgi:hypothetical protein
MKFFSVCDLIPLSNKGFRYLIILVSVTSIIAFTGCSSHPEGPPGKDVLKTDQFVQLLIDMHYFEGVYTLSGNISHYRPGGMMATDTIDFYQPVLDMHGVGRAEFKKSMEYYSYNPSQFEAIYDRVVDELNRRLREAEMQEPERYTASPAE